MVGKIALIIFIFSGKIQAFPRDIKSQQFASTWIQRIIFKLDGGKGMLAIKIY